jgi:hypothetical protein
MTLTVRILVVEDYAPFRFAFCSWLRERNFQIIEIGLAAMRTCTGKAVKGPGRLAACETSWGRKKSKAIKGSQ